MNRLFALSGILLACFARTLLAVDNTGATAGRWTYDVPAARHLADTTDRPLLVMFSNTSGACGWCNRFENEIDAGEEWNYYANEQQLAMAFINFDGPNWDEDYYLSLCSSNQTDITGFPAFALYTSDGSNLLAAFSFNATDTTYSASAFIGKIDDALESGNYQLNGEDLWDPADDTAVGATVLTFESYNLRQGHTLNKVSDSGVTDTDDWFKFLCVKGRKYLFQIPAYDYSANAATAVTNSQSHTYSNGVPLRGFSTNTVH